MKEWLKSIRQNFGNNLVVEIYKTTRPKMMNRRRIINLRDKSNICMVEFLKQKANLQKGTKIIEEGNLEGPSHFCRLSRSRFGI
jgi:hypothetical protein